MFFSADLSESVLSDGGHAPGSEQPAEGECPANNPALVPDEPEGFQNVFVRSSATGAYTLVSATPEGTTPGDAWFQDASADFSHVVFEDSSQLTEAAPAGASLYEWVSGAVSLVTVLPHGTPTVGTLPGAVTGGGNFAGTSPITHPVSIDGKRVIFEAQGKLFLRENVEQMMESAIGPEGECLESTKACTVQVDASQAGGSGGGGSFVAANTTDTRIFFTDEDTAKLTNDTTEKSGQHLYEYDTQTGKLNDLTPAGDFGLSGLSGISDDGAYLYVVAQAALDPEATSGHPNLYVVHNGSVGFVATLEDEDLQDSRDWSPNELTAHISANGHYIAFNSLREITGYENNPARPGECEVETLGENFPGPCSEIFLYDAAASSSKPICLSCATDGARPIGPSELPRAEEASDTPGPVYMQHNVLDDGRVFFDTANPLLLNAVNGVSNVYEFSGEQLSLISSGTSEANSFFYDASSNGDDVFFTTTQHLVRRDTANGMRLYDARVDGGYPEPAAPAQPCSGDDCRTPAASPFGSPTLGTVSPQGSGNLVPLRHTVKPLTRKQKLARALRACQRKRNPHKRAACRRQARARYGARSSSVKKRASK